MRTLITCGTPWCQLKSIQDTLVAAGLSLAKNAQSGSVVGVGPWHDRLFSGLGQVLEPVHPGKAWELAAGEILLANWDQTAWGWADNRSTWLMEFWRDFDPSTCFVVVHTPAYDVLKQLLTGGSPDQQQIQTVLDTWLSYQRELLRFYHRNRSRCVLVHSHQALHDEAKCLAKLNEELGTSFSIAGKSVQVTQNVDPLLHHVVKGLLDSRPDVLELEDEIRATLPDATETQPLPPGDILAAGASLQALYGKEALLLGALDAQQIRQLEQARESANHTAALAARLNEQVKLNDRLTQDVAIFHAQLNQATAQLDDAYSAKQELETQLTAVQGQAALVALEADQIARESKAQAEESAARWAAQEQEAAQLQSTVQAQSQESELLLLQLHQVQEELEQFFLENQALKTQLSTLKTSSDTWVTERDAEKTAKAQALAQRDAETKAKQEAIAQRDKLAQENAKSIASNEATVAANAVLTQERDAEKAAKAQALAQRDAETKAKQEAIAQRDALSKQQSNSESQKINQARQELSQENELLLLQLHQVQEELEHYFLQHQQAKADKGELEERLHALLARYPDHVEWDKVDIVSDVAPVRGQIMGLRAGNRQAALLDLTLSVVEQQPALILTPPADSKEHGLLYWPVASGASSDGVLAPLTLIPAAPPQSEAGALIRSLTQADVRLVRAACTALAESLPSTLADRAEWVQTTDSVRHQLASLSPVWRYDSVKLKRQQVNPDYEHLWLELGNACFGDRCWPSFEFRLSAANVKKGKFSHQPKLEFPLPAEGNKQFENWFEESEDDFGPKFEIRFDNKKKAMDVGVWNALSPLDQAQALSLIEQLPTLLHRVQISGCNIARPWQDWQTLATGLQLSLVHSLQLTSLVGAAC